MGDDEWQLRGDEHVARSRISGGGTASQAGLGGSIESWEARDPGEVGIHTPSITRQYVR